MLVVHRPSDQQFEKKVEITDDEGDHYTITQEYIAKYDATANDYKPLTQPIDVRGQIKFP